MKKTIGTLIRYYGQTLTTERGMMLKGFFRPLSAKGWSQMEKAIGDLGEIPKGQYLFLSTTDCGITEGARLQTAGKWYAVRTVETLYMADKAMYCWALLTEAGAEDGEPT